MRLELRKRFRAFLHPCEWSPKPAFGWAGDTMGIARGLLKNALMDRVAYGQRGDIELLELIPWPDNERSDKGLPWVVGAHVEKVFSSHLWAAVYLKRGSREVWAKRKHSIHSSDLVLDLQSAIRMAAKLSRDEGNHIGEQPSWMSLVTAPEKYEPGWENVKAHP